MGWRWVNSASGTHRLGYYDRGRLRYAGKVGTGYSDPVLRDLNSRLARLERPAR
jgi:bifunctional non-homologous end joining protein LigD